MKVMIFALYVSIVLMFSAFARADMVMPMSYGQFEQTPALVDSVQVDEAQMALEIVGRLPNPCFELPSASMEYAIHNQNTLVLRLSSPQPTGICVAPIARYRTVVSLPEVAQNAALQLEEQTTYLVRVEGHDFEMMVLGAELLRVPGFVGQ